MAPDQHRRSPPAYEDANFDIQGNEYYLASLSDEELEIRQALLKTILDTRYNGHFGTAEGFYWNLDRWYQKHLIVLVRRQLVYSILERVNLDSYTPRRQ